MDGVPYPQPLTGHKPQYVPWGVLLVRSIGHPPGSVPPRAADQRFGCIPPGADTVLEQIIKGFRAAITKKNAFVGQKWRKKAFFSPKTVFVGPECSQLGPHTLF